MRELIKTAKALYAKWQHCTDKAEQLAITLGLTLAEAKERKPSTITWPEFVKKHFDFGRSRADELIQIAEGRTTVEKVRADTAKRVMKHAKKPPLANGGSQSQQSGSAVAVFGDRPMSNAAAKQLERKNAEVELKALHDQVGVFHHELVNYIHDDYCPRLTAWFEAHPQLDGEGKGGLIQMLETCAMTLQQLAQKIDGR